MNKLARTFAVAMTCSVLASASQAGQIYKRVDADGNVYFSDSPMEGGAEIEVKPLPTMPMPKAIVPEPRAEKAAAVKEEKEPEGYTSISITSPANGITLRQDADPLTISVSVAPALQEGHAIQALMDGALRGEPSTTNTVTINGISRGAHQITARVVDATGAPILTSAPVTIYMHRTSVNNPNHPNNPKNTGAAKPPAYTPNPGRALQPNPKPKPLSGR